MRHILIADDHEVVRSGLRSVLETCPEWKVVGEATNGEQAVSLTLEMRPDVLIVDYSMPVMSGLEVCRRLKSLKVSTEILMLTMHETEELFAEAVLAGVRGFVLKSDARKHLFSAIEAVLEGRPYFTTALLEKLLSDYRANKQKTSGGILTSREQNVVQLIAEGHTNKSIGNMLKLSVKTVETHRAVAMRKLGISSTAELVRYAVRKKLVIP